MIYVFVLAEDGTRLMPTDIRHARRLLKKKEAVIAGHKPFTIQLTRPSEHHVQPIEFCCDTGSEHIGVSIKSEKHEFIHNQYDNLKDEKRRHANRLKMRRTRRGRKRYRKARFDNRKKDKGWIAPSLENKEQNHLRIAAKYNKICPIIQATKSRSLSSRDGTTVSCRSSMTQSTVISATGKRNPSALTRSRGYIIAADGHESSERKKVKTAP